MERIGQNTYKGRGTFLLIVIAVSSLFIFLGYTPDSKDAKGFNANEYIVNEDSNIIEELKIIKNEQEIQRIREGIRAQSSHKPKKEEKKLEKNIEKNVENKKENAKSIENENKTEVDGKEEVALKNEAAVTDNQESVDTAPVEQPLAQPEKEVVSQENPDPEVTEVVTQEPEKEDDVFVPKYQPNSIYSGESVVATLIGNVAYVDSSVLYLGQIMITDSLGERRVAQLSNVFMLTSDGFNLETGNQMGDVLTGAYSPVLIYKEPNGNLLVAQVW